MKSIEIKCTQWSLVEDTGYVNWVVKAEQVQNTTF